MSDIAAAMEIWAELAMGGIAVILFASAKLKPTRKCSLGFPLSIETGL